MRPFKYELWMQLDVQSFKSRLIIVERPLREIEKLFFEKLSLN